MDLRYPLSTAMGFILLLIFVVLPGFSFAGFCFSLFAEGIAELTEGRTIRGSLEIAGGFALLAAGIAAVFLLRELLFSSMSFRP